VGNYTHHDVNIDDLKYYCFWCPKEQRQAMTYIEIDLDLHLREHHRMAMVKLPIGKGDMDTRIDYAVDQCVQMTLHLRAYPEKWAKLFKSSQPLPSTTSIPTNPKAAVTFSKSEIGAHGEA